jgi:hypothetical protein
MRTHGKKTSDSTKRKIEAGKRRDKDKLTNTFELDFDTEKDLYHLDVRGKKGELFDYLKSFGKWQSRQAIIKSFKGEGLSEGSIMYHINQLMDEKVISKMKLNGKIGYVVNVKEELEYE